MIYPVYVHKDENSAYGVTIPNFPGCFSAADKWDDIPVMIQEAVELYCDGEDIDIPQPTPLDEVMKNTDYDGGTWMSVDIDVSKLQTEIVQVNINLNQNLLNDIDQYAKNHKLSRSRFLSMAAKKALSTMK